MIARSSLSVGLALLTAGFMVTGCERGGASKSTVSSGSSASASATPSQDPAITAQKAACAAFRDAVASTNAANHAFVNAADDPKRVGDQYNKAMTDAANSAVVIFPYAADQIEGAITPQVPKGLAGKLGDFVQILQDRANLYAQHQSGDLLNASIAKYTPAANDLLKECPTGSSDAEPPKPTTAPVASAGQAKQKFCDVYSKQIQNTEDANGRFSAAIAGDEQHPSPQWDNPDKWLAGAADNAAIIFNYAATTLEAQTLPPELADKVKALVAAMRKLGGLYKDHKATQLQGVSEGEYGPAAEAVDTVCGIA